MDFEAINKISYGVYAILVKDRKNNKDTGCIANSTMQITTNPAMIAVSINKVNYTNDCIENENFFSVNILSEKVDPRIIAKLGFTSGRNINKLENIDYKLNENIPILKNACAYLECEVVNKIEVETHNIFIAKIINAKVISEEKPMTYDYYHTVIKGKTHQNAPTYNKTV